MSCMKQKGVRVFTDLKVLLNSSEILKQTTLEIFYIYVISKGAAAERFALEHAEIVCVHEKSRKLCKESQSRIETERERFVCEATALTAAAYCPNCQR